MLDSPCVNGRVNTLSVPKRWLIGLSAGLIVIALGAFALAAAIDARHFRGTVLKLISARVGRPIEVAGAFTVTLLSRHPTVVAERVTIGNPSWMPAGSLAEIGELSLMISLPGIHHRFGIERLSIRAATLHLERDASGRANWQWTSPGHAPSKHRMQILKSLSVPGAHVLLADERRHLHFDGTVSAQSEDDETPLKMQGSGELNGKPVTFDLTGDSLAASSHERPYHFSYSERSSGSTLSGRGDLPQPFDFTEVDASFQAAGADLKDLYYLAGVSLINTGSYRLSGKFARRGNAFAFGGLEVATGESDVRGSVLIVSSPQGPPSLEADLKSHFLRLADLGLRAAGRAPPIDEKTRLLLSTAALNPATLRRGVARVKFSARRLEVGRFTLSDLAAHGTLDQRVLSLTSLSAGLMGGKLNARATIDAKSDPPNATADIRIADAQLAQYPWKSPGPAPIEGAMRAHILITGKGASIHDIAASADGTVAAIIPDGVVRDSFAELTDIDLRGLGMLLAKDKHDTALRCAVAVFKATHGTLAVERLVADTEPVMIEGSGEIRLDSEALDLAIHGQPKSVRLLRVNSPLKVGGTLAHPQVSIESHQIKLIDRGRGVDADCPGLIAEADAGGHPAAEKAPSPNHP